MNRLTPWTRPVGLVVLAAVFTTGMLGGRFSPQLTSTVRSLLGRSGVTYPGASEYERERSSEELELIDQMTLLLRAQGAIEFLGVPMAQIPTDNWLMSDLIFSVKPDYIIETGTLFGGSALYYAGLLELVNPNGRVITVDINEDAIYGDARDHDLFKRRVRFIRGGSTDAETIEQIRREVGTGMTVLVTLDTLHAPRHVRRELELYSEFVSTGSYIIVQDTFFEGLPEAIDDFLTSHDDFARDTELDERHIFTKHRGGFLRRD